MLVLSRKPGERFLIHPGSEDEIVVEVLEVRGGRVRLGITAPLEIRVSRQELLDAPKDQKGDKPCR